MKSSGIQFGVSLDQQLDRLIEQSYVSRNPKAPIKIPAFVSTDLPAAADWAQCIIYVIDKSTAAVSTGSGWVRADGSPL